MTTLALEEDRQDSLAKGMDDYIVKPFQIEGLMNIFMKFAKN
jgi:CheY-like chemotaxis protein